MEIVFHLQELEPEIACMIILYISWCARTLKRNLDNSLTAEPYLFMCATSHRLHVSMMNPPKF